MKKIIFMVAFLCVCLVGCSGLGANNPGEGNIPETETNSTVQESASGVIDEMGTTEQSSEKDPVPPGTIPEPSDIVQPSQDEVGKTGNYSFDIFEGTSFAYFFNESTQKERLVLVSTPALGEKESKLIVLEIALGGFDGLKSALTTSFEAKLLAYVNISFEEGMYAMGAAAPGAGMQAKYNQYEIVDFAVEVGNSKGVQFYLGHIFKEYPSNTGGVVNELSTSKYVTMLANRNVEESNELLNRKAVYDRIFVRFELNDIVSVE